MTAGAGDQAAVNLAEWAVKYAAAKLAVLPLHSIRDGRCTCWSARSRPAVRWHPGP
jgi:hypothetical protein